MLFNSIHTRSALAYCQLVRRGLVMTAGNHGTLCQTSACQKRGVGYQSHKQCQKSLFKLSKFYVHDIFQRYLHVLPKSNVPYIACNHNIFPDSNFSIQRKLSSSTFIKSDATVTPIFIRVQDFVDRLAVISQHGRYTYEDVLNYSAKLAQELQKLLKQTETKDDFSHPRIAFLCENDLSYIVTQWAIFMVGGIAVPLCKQHPTNEMQYFIEDSGASIIVGTSEYAEKVRPIAINLNVPMMILTVDDYTDEVEDYTDWLADQRILMTDKLHHNEFKDEPAMFIYTSGTTGRPKGVVYTYGNIDAQMQGMIEAWGWTSSDVILHVLPLHHVHGIVNVLMTALYCGAACKMLPKFDAKETWKALLNQNTWTPVNVFMAVPTIYAKLIEAYDSLMEEEGVLPSKDDIKSLLQKTVRLMVSGSAALPQPVMERWEDITGHRLLERYGMTETGMVLTNPLHGTRTPGAVGNPFPGVEVSITKHQEDSDEEVVIATGDSQQTKVTPGYEEESGELLVRGPSVFHQYWKRPGATEDAFTKDGWFKTGDTVMYKEGNYKIVGRTSVDVIKSGGYKISALDIERHLLEHPSIRDVAVVGLPDMTWGQVIAAVLVLKDGHTLSMDELKNWAGDKMISYHIPKVRKLLEQMPRNAMGKVNKKDLVKTMFPEYVEEK